jgi:hypothetical protein
MLSGEKPASNSSTFSLTKTTTAQQSQAPTRIRTDRLDIADSIVKKVHHGSGRLWYCNALNIKLKDQGIVQVSMNLTGYPKTAIYRDFELIRIEARRFGVNGGIMLHKVVGPGTKPCFWPEKLSGVFRPYDFAGSWGFSEQFE